MSETTLLTEVQYSYINVINFEINCFKKVNIKYNC